MEATKAASLISSGYAVPVEEAAVESVELITEPEAEPVEKPKKAVRSKR